MPDPATGAPARVWGPAATLGWGALLTLVTFQAQLVVAWLVVRLAPRAIERGASMDGDLLGAPVLASAALGLPAIAAVIALARGAPLPRYLALAWPGWWPVARWMGAMAAVAIIYDLLARALDRPLVPTVMLDAWRTTDWPALFWAAVVVAAPLVEEALFRGFFFAGLERSRFGPTLATVLPAVVWTLLHLQYDAFDLSFVLVLGLARWRTGSLATCLLAHGLVNLVAMIEMVLVGGD